jgi:hypothetical protein
MTTFPKSAKQVLPAMIKKAVTDLAKHTQQIVTLQSQAAAATALQPGAWSAITLQAGWSNVAGAVPAQVRLLTSTTVQVIGNISGGTVTSGTVIGTLAPGFYNAVHSHTFSVTAVAGAGTVAAAVSQGSLQNTAVTQGFMIDGFVSQGVLDDANGYITATTGGTDGKGTITLNSNELHATQQLNNPNVANNQTLVSGVLSTGQTTSVSYNQPALTLGTNGTLTLINVNSAVTQLSFHESGLPLFTA